MPIKASQYKVQSVLSASNYHPPSPAPPVIHSEDFTFWYSSYVVTLK